MWWVIVAAIVCILGLIAWTAPVVVQVQFQRIAGDDEGEVSVRYLYGLVRIKRSLSMLNARFTNEGPQLHVHHEGAMDPNHKKEKVISASDMWEVIKNLSKWIDFFHAILPIVRHFWSKVHIRHLNLNLSIGTGDAVFTGVAVGALFGIANLALGTSSRHTVFDVTPQIEIQPNFHQLEFQIDFRSIIRVRAGYAISAALRLFFVWKRRISDGAPDTRSDADSHGEHSGNGRREHDYRRSG
jgi:hypothetical protein